MAANFPFYVTAEGEEIPVISGVEVTAAGTKYRIADGELQLIEFLKQIS